MPEEIAEEFTGIPETTEAEEMYLITVAFAAEDGHRGPLALTALGDALGLSAASVNAMVRKLAKRSLVTYEPYRGVALTEFGSVVAQRVLRTRRLWSTFLCKHLDYAPQDADKLACNLEHVTPEDAADRLARYLGDPTLGPLGRPIPRRGLQADLPAGEPLSTVPAGTVAEIVFVAADDTTTRFLASQGVTPGVRVTVIGAGDSAVLAEVAGSAIHLTAPVAESVLVQTPGGRHRAP